MRQWRLEPDDLRDHRRNEGSIGLNPSKFFGKLIEEENTARHRVTCGVIATHDEQHEVTDVIHGVVHHVSGVLVALKQSNQIKGLDVIADSLVPQPSKDLKDLHDDLKPIFLL